MNLTSDERKWKESTESELRTISEMWAKNFTYKQLRAFQSSYVLYMQKPEVSDEQYQAYNNMWQTATWAIDFQYFGQGE